MNGHPEPTLKTGWSSGLAPNFLAASAAALVLCSADCLALHLVREGVFSSAATWVQLALLSLGAALSLFLPAAALLATTAFLLDRPRLRRADVVLAALALAAAVLVLNQRFTSNKTWFLAALLVAAASFGAGLRLLVVRFRGRKKPSILAAGLLLLLAATLFLLDVTQLPGLYSAQHVTVGLFTWLSVHAAVVLLLSLRRDLLPVSRVPRLAAMAGLVVLAISLVLFWVTPGDAVSESLRWAANSGSTTTREILHLLSAGTDLDRDGHSSLLGRGDCAPFDPTVHPGAPEIPGDDIDGNCLAGDPLPQDVDALAAALTALRPPLGRSWRNVLLLSVDALRHDRVFGPKAVPDLSKLVADAVVLERAWCLYPGTVPSLYGLVTSRPPVPCQKSWPEMPEVPALKGTLPPLDRGFKS